MPSKPRAAKCSHSILEGEQLALNATVPTENSKNRIWGAIKSVGPTFADLKHNISVVPGKRVYTVQAGDNLSKISRQFYGDANRLHENRAGQRPLRS